MGFCIKSDLSVLCRTNVIDKQTSGWNSRFEVFTFENLLLVTRHISVGKGCFVFLHSSESYIFMFRREAIYVYGDIHSKITASDDYLKKWVRRPAGQVMNC